MTHPLTDFVKNMLTTRHVVDRFDVAIALGAPNETNVWEAYLTVADDILTTMADEGALTSVPMGPNSILFERKRAPRAYRETAHG